MGNCGSEEKVRSGNVPAKRKWVKEYVEYLNEKHTVRNQDHEYLLLLLKLLPTYDLLELHAHYLALPSALQGNAAMVRHCNLLVRDRVR